VLTAKDEVSWNKNQLIASQEYLQSSTASSVTGGGLALEGSLKNFDPISRTLSKLAVLSKIMKLTLLTRTAVEWSGLKVDPDNPEADAVPFVNTTGLSNAFPIEIYREIATTIWIPDPPYNPEDPTSLLYYRIANLSTPAIAVIGWTEDDSFDTEISFKQAQDTSVITRLPLFAYPFDE
ncbi:9431_t:CDS:2, partial [Acaulospora colombiana]